MKRRELLRVSMKRWWTYSRLKELGLRNVERRVQWNEAAGMLKRNAGRVAKILDSPLFPCETIRNAREFRPRARCLTLIRADRGHRVMFDTVESNGRRFFGTVWCGTRVERFLRGPGRGRGGGGDGGGAGNLSRRKSCSRTEISAGANLAAGRSGLRKRGAGRGRGGAGAGAGRGGPRPFW